LRNSFSRGKRDLALEGRTKRVCTDDLLSTSAEQLRIRRILCLINVTALQKNQSGDRATVFFAIG
jgi:hypothetical protein